jgi:hypothetical protein
MAADHHRHLDSGESIVAATNQSCTRRDPDGTLALSTAPSEQEGQLTPAMTCGLSGADDGIRTRDPHLGKVVLYR